MAGAGRALTRRSSPCATRRCAASRSTRSASGGSPSRSTAPRSTVLRSSSPSAESAPVSLDIAVFVLAGSAAAIDAGDFELLIGPNLGAQEAGRNLGRFADLLGAAGSAALAAVAAADALQQSGRRAGGARLPAAPRALGQRRHQAGDPPLRDRRRDDAGRRRAGRDRAVGGAHRRARRALLRPLAGGRGRPARVHRPHAQRSSGARCVPLPRRRRTRRADAARLLRLGSGVGAAIRAARSEWPDRAGPGPMADRPRGARREPRAVRARTSPRRWRAGERRGWFRATSTSRLPTTGCCSISRRPTRWSSCARSSPSCRTAASSCSRSRCPGLSMPGWPDRTAAT